MARIRVTGYIYTDELQDGQLDLKHRMGITDEAFETLVHGQAGERLTLMDLDEVDFELEEE